MNDRYPPPEDDRVAKVATIVLCSVFVAAVVVMAVILVQG